MNQNAQRAGSLAAAAPEFPTTVTEGLQTLGETLNKLQQVCTELRKRLDPVSTQRVICPAETGPTLVPASVCALQGEIRQLNDFADQIRGELCDTMTNLRI